MGCLQAYCTCYNVSMAIYMLKFGGFHRLELGSHYAEGPWEDRLASTYICKCCATNTHTCKLLDQPFSTTELLDSSRGCLKFLDLWLIELPSDSGCIAPELVTLALFQSQQHDNNLFSCLYRSGIWPSLWGEQSWGLHWGLSTNVSGILSFTPNKFILVRVS